MLSNCAILIPVYNNERTIGSVLDKVVQYSDTVLVVNDGSTDKTGTILADRKDITLLTHEHNCGKGAAIRFGFEYAYKIGFSHVITLDADGQHNPVELPHFWDKIREDPEAIWIGARTIDGARKAPFKNMLGRHFGNGWIRLYTGFKLSDTQSGYRLYPLHPLAPLECRTNRFDYEQEVLLEAAWTGVDLKEFPIEQIYQSKEERVSHFHPMKDFVRIGRVHARAMFTRVLNPFSSLKVEGKNTREKIFNLVKQELINHTTPLKAALAFALGVFMGTFPIHGFQVVTLMFLATKFRLNRPIAYLGVNVSAPPFLPFLIVAAVKLGDIFLPGVINTDQINDSMIKKGGAGFLAFVIGSVLLAPILAVMAFLISFPIFTTIKKNKECVKCDSD